MKILRFLAWLALALAGLSFALALTALALLASALEASPTVEREPSLSPRSITQARQILVQNDPRRLQAGDLRAAILPVRLADDAANHLASRVRDARARVETLDDLVRVHASLRLPGVPQRPFVNIRADIRTTGGLPELQGFRIGRLELPPALVLTATRLAIQTSGVSEEAELLRRSIVAVSVAPGGRNLQIAYVWDPAMLERLRTRAVAEVDPEQLRSVNDALSAMLSHRAANVPIRLTEILPALRAGDESDGFARQRSVLLILAAYLGGKDLSKLIPELGGWKRPVPRELILHDRNDIAQHFIISAALAAWAGEPLAEAIGVWKELEDARAGSGFSFADLAADRAGTRFGQLVRERDPRIEILLAGAVLDGDLLPSLAGLPEYIPAAEFRRRYGSTDSPAYRALIDDIDRRITALALYR